MRWGERESDEAEALEEGMQASASLLNKTNILQQSKWKCSSAQTELSKHYVNNKPGTPATMNSFSFVLQFAARCWGDGTEQSGEARVWGRNQELLLWGGLHLWEHWERAVLLHLTGQCESHARRQRAVKTFAWLACLVRCRRDRASLNTGWTIYVPNTERCCIISTSSRASRSVSCFLYCICSCLVKTGSNKEGNEILWVWIAVISLTALFLIVYLDSVLLYCSPQSQSWVHEVWSSRCFLSMSRESSVSSWSPGFRLCVRSSPWVS